MRILTHRPLQKFDLAATPREFASRSIWWTRLCARRSGAVMAG